MKKRIFTILIALILAIGISTPIFAGDGGDANANVDVSDIDVNNILGDLIIAGGTYTISGTVTIQASATDVEGWLVKMAEASGSGWYEVKAPDGTIIQIDGDSISVTDINFGSFEWQGYGWHRHLVYIPPEDATADIGTWVYTWEYELNVGQLGYYDVSQYGEAYAKYLEGFGFETDYDNDSVSRQLNAVSGQIAFASSTESQQHPSWGLGGFTVQLLTDGKSGWGNTPWQGGISTRTTATAINAKAGGLTLNIPAETVVNGDAPFSCSWFEVNYTNSVFSFSPASVTFSKPVTITDATGAVLLEFTSVVNGVAQ